MIKTNHKLEISKDGTQRVVCGANGRWRLQSSTGYERVRGTKDGSDKANLEWTNKGPPASYDECKRNASHELREGW